MTESMIERVAKALCVQSGIIWDKQSDAQRAHNLALAREAIEAMREPTDLQFEDAKKATWLGSAMADRVWRAMIDAALKWPAGSADRAGVPMARD